MEIKHESIKMEIDKTSSRKDRLNAGKENFHIASLREHP